jgi:N-acetylglutamate synthase-like GNAT family acetyltransferase
MFKRSIEDHEIASQVAGLLNKYNGLNTSYTLSHILDTQNDYIVETFGTIVIGCIKIERQSYNISELKHLVVLPEMRRKGIAVSLIKIGIIKAQSPIIYAMIRDDNIFSRHTFEQAGFSNTGLYTTGERDVLFYTSTSPKWKKQVVAV